jgi:hypothetical protein
VKIKLHSNENIEWHCMKLEFNSNALNRIGLSFGNAPPSVEEKYC